MLGHIDLAPTFSSTTSGKGEAARRAPVAAAAEAPGAGRRRPDPCQWAGWCSPPLPVSFCGPPAAGQVTLRQYFLLPEPRPAPGSVRLMRLGRAARSSGRGGPVQGSGGAAAAPGLHRGAVRGRGALRGSAAAAEAPGASGCSFGAKAGKCERDLRGLQGCCSALRGRARGGAGAEEKLAAPAACERAASP